MLHTEPFIRGGGGAKSLLRWSQSIDLPSGHASDLWNHHASCAFYEVGLKVCSDGHCHCWLVVFLSMPLNDFFEITMLHMEPSIKGGLKVCLDGHNPLTCHLSDIWPSLWMTSLKSPCFMCSLLLKAIESLLRWSQSVDLSSVHAFEWQKSPCFIWDWKFAEMVTVGWLAICLSSDHAFEWLLSNHHASYGAFYWRKVESLLRWSLRWFAICLSSDGAFYWRRIENLLRWSHSVDLPSVCHLYTPLNNFYQITMHHMEPSIEGRLKVCSDGHNPLTCHLSVICPCLWMTFLKWQCFIWSLLLKRGWKFTQMVSLLTCHLSSIYPRLWMTSQKSAWSVNVHLATPTICFKRLLRLHPWAKWLVNQNS